MRFTSSTQVRQSLNDLFTSSNPERVTEFFAHFGSAAELFDWMRSRPKAEPEIHLVAGRSDAVVVIPTVDYDGALARHCRNRVFAGLQMVFLSAGGKPDPYFNFAHTVNQGLKIALEFSPRWIVYSSDDVFLIDPPEVLERALANIDPAEKKAVFTRPSRYHSIPTKLAERNVFGLLLFHILGRHRRSQLLIERKFEVKYHSIPARRFAGFFFKPGYRSLSIADFGVFSSSYVQSRGGALFDETYVNSAEDVDLSLELTASPTDYAVIDYRLGDYVGRSLGTGVDRKLRDLAGAAYFNYKLRVGSHPASRLVARRH